MRIFLLAALLAIALAQNCGQNLGVLIETESAIYSFQHVPADDVHVGCVSVWSTTNPFPAASFPGVNSQPTEVFPATLTLARNPANKACGLRLTQPDGSMSWNITFPAQYSYFCPADPTQPSPLLTVFANAQGIAVAATAGGNISLATLNFDGSVFSACSFPLDSPPYITGQATAASTDGQNLAIATDGDSLIFLPTEFGRYCSSSSSNAAAPATIPTTAQVSMIAQDTVFQQFMYQWFIPGNATTSTPAHYGVGCGSIYTAAPQSPITLPLATPMDVFAARAAYDGYSHNWWQFTDNGALSQFNGMNCPAVLVHSYAVPAGTPLPWDTNTRVNVFAVPV